MFVTLSFFRKKFRHYRSDGFRRTRYQSFVQHRYNSWCFSNFVIDRPGISSRRAFMAVQIENVDSAVPHRAPALLFMDGYFVNALSLATVCLFDRISKGEECIRHG